MWVKNEMRRSRQQKQMMVIKRIFDTVISVLFIILLLPLFLFIPLIIILNSKGPAFFKQKRLGLDGQEFFIIKFRTMIVNAEYMGEGKRIASEHDPRITKIGKFLRKTSFDELPQLFNVIKGEMSLIGPRPPLTYFPYNGHENYPIDVQGRFLVRPGITGLSQVKVRNSAPWPARLALDMEYVNKMTIRLDLTILFHTVKRILSPMAVYPETKSQDSSNMELNE